MLKKWSTVETRPFFLQDRQLLDCLFSSVRGVILRMFHSANKSECFIPGFICVLHTFGRDLKWNPHIHCLISEGGIGSSGRWRPFMHFNYRLLRLSFQTALLNEMQKRIGDSFKKVTTVILSHFTTTGTKTTDLFTKPFPLWSSCRSLSGISPERISRWSVIMASVHVTAALAESHAVSYQRKNTVSFCLSTAGVTACYPLSAMTPLNAPAVTPQCFSLHSALTINGFLWMNYMKGQWLSTTAAAPHPARSPLVQCPPAVVNYLWNGGLPHE